MLGYKAVASALTLLNGDLESIAYSVYGCRLPYCSNGTVAQ